MIGNVVVLAVRLVDAAPGLSGSRLVATFDVAVAGIVIRGCHLVEPPAGSPIVHPPRLKSGAARQAGTSYAIEFTDPELRRAVAEAARAAWVAERGGHGRAGPFSSA